MTDFLDAPPSDSPAERKRSSAGRKPRRRRDKEASRGELLKATFDLLSEGRRVTTVEVTRRAGLAQSSFYAHFKDVDECALDAVRTVIARIEEHAHEREGFLQFPPGDKKALEAHIARLLGDKNIGETNAVFNRYKNDPGPIGDAVRRHLGAMRASLLEDMWKIAVIAGVGSEHYRDFALQADLIVGSLVYATSVIHEGRYRDPERVAHALARNFWEANARLIRDCGGDPQRLREAFARWPTQPPPRMAASDK